MTFGECLATIRGMCREGERPSVVVEASVRRNGDLDIEWTCHIHDPYGDTWINDGECLTAESLVAVVRAYLQAPPKATQADIDAVGDVSL